MNFSYQGDPFDAAKLSIANYEHLNEILLKVIKHFPRFEHRFKKMCNMIAIHEKDIRLELISCLRFI